MQFLAQIYAAENSDDVSTPELLGQYEAFEAELKEKGVKVSGNALEVVSTATTVRLREGKVQLTDGPFAETKEQLGGYYLFDCKDLDEALKWAAKIPSACYGSIELRPIVTFDE